MLDDRERARVAQAATDWENGCQTIAWQLKEFFRENKLHCEFEAVGKSPEANLRAARRSVVSTLRILEAHGFLISPTDPELCILWRVGADCPLLSRPGDSWHGVRGAINDDGDICGVVERLKGYVRRSPSPDLSLWKTEIVDPTIEFACEWRNWWKSILAKVGNGERLQCCIAKVQNLFEKDPSMQNLKAGEIVKRIGRRKEDVLAAIRHVREGDAKFPVPGTGIPP